MGPKRHKGGRVVNKQETKYDVFVRIWGQGGGGGSKFVVVGSALFLCLCLCHCLCHCLCLVSNWGWVVEAGRSLLSLDQHVVCVFVFVFVIVFVFVL